MAETELVTIPVYPLAYDANAEPLALPPEAVKFHIKETTRGRPKLVYDRETGKEAELPLTATMLDLRRVVPGPGHYRLHPIDGAGRELTPVAHVEVVPEGELESLCPPYMSEKATGRDDHMHEIVERLLGQREAQDLMMADMLKTLVTTTAVIQRSTAELLMAANTTIKIANGVEALERQEPTVDVEALGAKLSEVLAPAESAKPETPWYMQMLSSPLGAPLAQLMTSFASTLVANQQIQPPRPAAVSPAAVAAAAPAAPPTTTAAAATAQSAPEAIGGESDDGPDDMDERSDSEPMEETESADELCKRHDLKSNGEAMPVTGQHGLHETQPRPPPPSSKATRKGRKKTARKHIRRHRRARR